MVLGLVRGLVAGLTAGLVALALLGPGTAGAQQVPLRLLGGYSFPSKTVFAETTVGGLSGLVYDPRRDVYYAVSDDRGELGPPRFYTLRIDFDLGGIHNVQGLAVTTLDSDAATPGIQPYEPNTSDTEEIVLLPNDELLISSERDASGRPWLRRFALDGTLLGELPIPEKFLTVSRQDEGGRNVVVSGVRSNLGFEGLALSPDGQTLWAANEEALAQDGPIATTSSGTLVRFLRYDLAGPTARPGAEYVYQTDPIFSTPNPPTAFADNGISALVWIRHQLPEYDVLALERSFVTGVGNDVTIYGVRLAGARDVAGLAALPAPFSGPLLAKTRLANMAQLGVEADNLEALALGPRLPNGKPSLLVMSDDNFSALEPPQVNQFLLFEVDQVSGK